MHLLLGQSSAITSDVIGAAIEVHRDRGPGLLESIYEWCLTMQLEERGRKCKRKRMSPSIQVAFSRRNASIRLANRPLLVG